MQRIILPLLQVYCKIVEVEQSPSSYPVALSDEEQAALDAEHSIDSFSIDLADEDDLEWEECLPESTARPVDEVSMSYPPLTALSSHAKPSLPASRSLPWMRQAKIFPFAITYAHCHSCLPKANAGVQEAVRSSQTWLRNLHQAQRPLWEAVRSLLILNALPQQAPASKLLY